MKVDLCGRCQSPLTEATWYPSARKRRWLICKSCEKLRQEQYRTKNPKQWQKHNLKTKYGLTLDKYNKLYEDQNGVCAICSQPENTPRRRNLCVDHDHSTGEVRGLLCNDCNTGIGKLKDDPDLLIKASEYLWKYR